MKLVFPVCSPIMCVMFKSQIMKTVYAVKGTIVALLLLKLLLLPAMLLFDSNI
jgi:hypothetical protein